MIWHKNTTKPVSRLCCKTRTYLNPTIEAKNMHHTFKFRQKSFTWILYVPLLGDHSCRHWFGVCNSCQPRLYIRWNYQKKPITASAVVVTSAPVSFQSLQVGSIVNPQRLALCWGQSLPGGPSQDFAYTGEVAGGHFGDARPSVIKKVPGQFSCAFNSFFVWNVLLITNFIAYVKSNKVDTVALHYLATHTSFDKAG